ncbi:hypothetical protein D3C81_1874790 [compost metagenome]
MAYREDRGWGFGDGGTPKSHVIHLEQQVAELQGRVQRLEAVTGTTHSALPTDNKGEGI